MYERITLAVALFSLTAVGLGPHLRVVQLAAGGDFTCARFNNGRVKCWGGNQSGQLGLGHTRPIGTKLDEMGRALPFLDLGTDATAPEGKIRATSISAGQSHACALLTNGKLKCWGSNASGEIFLPEGGSRGGTPEEMGEGLKEVQLKMNGATPRSVAGLASATCVAAGENRVECTGNGWNGLRRMIPIPIKFYRGIDFEGMGHLRPTYPVPYFTRETLTLDGNIARIEGGESFACSLFVEGKVQCWGESSYGALGGTVVESPREGQVTPKNVVLLGGRALQISLGDNHACALMTDDRVKCWGAGAAGQLGLGDSYARGTRPTDMGENLKSVDIGDAGNKIVRIRCGHKRSCAILENGGVKCWGALIQGNNHTEAIGDEPGEMGEGLDYLPLGPLDEVDDLALGVGHGCALLKKDGEVKCWGANNVGQLGVGSTRATYPDGMGRALRPVQLN